MMPPELPHLRSFRVVLWPIGFFLFFRFLLTPLLPFLIALGLCALLEPLVQRLRRTMGVKRSFAAVAVTSALLLILGTTVSLLTYRLIEELAAWSDRLPELIDSFPEFWNSVLHRFTFWYASCPPFLRSALDHLANALSENTPEMVGAVGSMAMEKISALLAALPGITMFVVTTILALYFTSVNYCSILAFLKRQLPAAWQTRCRSAVQCCRSAMLKWLRSEMLMILVTFSIMLIGFLWMGLDFALLAAVFTALVDALPVLGTGTVLLPWAAFAYFSGNSTRALALLALYGAALLVRSLLEPKLLAGQAGLPSIAVLLAAYLGYRFFGVGGMVLLPVLLLLAKQLQDAGVIRLWR